MVVGKSAQRAELAGCFMGLLQVQNTVHTVPLQEANVGAQTKIRDVDMCILYVGR